MAQVSMNAYDADVYIPEFRGLMQYGDHMNGDLRYSPDCMNIETPGGVLQPSPEINGSILLSKFSGAGKFTVLGEEVGTLMHLRRSYNPVTPSYIELQKGGATAQFKGGEYDQYIYVVKNKVFHMEVTGELKESGWYNITDYGLTQTLAAKIIEAPWTWVTYEHTTGSGLLASTGNVVLMNNKDAGLFAIGHDISTVDEVSTPAKFQCIARYAERIWGVGGDTIYYSKPYDYSDWTQDNDDPANGGGEIREPTFDKDKIVAMKQLGDALIFFSEKRAWRMTGTDPSSFVITEQLGNGTKYPETIVVMGDRIIMMGDEGLMQYDGYHVTPLMHEATSEIFKNIPYGKNTTPRAIRMGEKYVLAMNTAIGQQACWEYGVNESGTISSTIDRFNGNGYRTLVYDTFDNTITQMNSPKIMSFCEGTPYFVSYFMGAAPAGSITLDPALYEYQDDDDKRYNRLDRMRFDSWAMKRCTKEATRWVSPWVTFGRADIKKGGFDLYFTPEIGRRKSIDHQLWDGGTFSTTTNDNPTRFEESQSTVANSHVAFKITIQTEKKSKTKQYTAYAVDNSSVLPTNSVSAPFMSILDEKQSKAKKMHFGGSGRRFRVIIETEYGNTIPWRLIGGIHIIAETDKD